jgi:hypothetical protein
MERTRLKWIEDINEYCNDLQQKVYSEYLNVYIVSIEGVGFRFMGIHDLINYLEYVCININSFAERYGHRMLSYIFFNEDIEGYVPDRDFAKVHLTIGKLNNDTWSFYYKEFETTLILDELSSVHVCEALGFDYDTVFF